MITENQKIIINEYKRYNNFLLKQITDLENNTPATSSLFQIQEDFKKSISKYAEDAAVELESCKNEYVWDKLVISFFGQTNAGKSTIIEVLRILFDEETRKVSLQNAGNGVDGFIIGNGKNDFTTEYTEYNLDIGGQPFILIDVPGIEGNESDFESNIKKALKKSHMVFYVQGENKMPDTEISKRIRKYLNDWIKVYTVFNIRGGAGNYDMAEDRDNLRTENIIKIEAQIEENFRQQLGGVYKGNISVQALLALCAHAQFTNQRPDLLKTQDKLLKYFETPANLFDFSNFGEIKECIQNQTANFSTGILEANKLKLINIGNETRRAITEHVRKEGLNLMKILDAMRKLKIVLGKEIDSCSYRIQRDCTDLINTQFAYIKNEVCEAIDKKKSKQEREDLLTNFQSELNNSLQDIIQAIIKENVAVLNANMQRESHTIQELHESLFLKNQSSFSVINLQLEDAFAELEIKLEDFTELLTMVVTNAVLLALRFINPWTIAISVVGYGLKKLFFSDGGRSKAKKKVIKLIEKNRDDLLTNLEKPLLELRSKLLEHKISAEIRFEEEIEKLERFQVMVSDTEQKIAHFTKRNRKTKYETI